MTCDEYKTVRQRMIDSFLVDQSVPIDALCTVAEAKALSRHLHSCPSCANIIDKETRDRVLREHPEIDVLARQAAVRKVSQMSDDPECQ